MSPVQKSWLLDKRDKTYIFVWNGRYPSGQCSFTARGETMGEWYFDSNTKMCDQCPMFSAILRFLCWIFLCKSLSFYSDPEQNIQNLFLCV